LGLSAEQIAQLEAAGVIVGNHQGTDH
jgi:hypothetical protein